MKLESNAKRLILYFMYDKDGIIDDYVIFMLENLQKVSSEIMVISNGDLSDEGKEKLNNIHVKIKERPNEGYDVWSYKTGLEHYGWEKLEDYDEIIMMNFTIMGPVFPLEEMFASMDKKDLDFWGITKFHEYSAGDPFGTISYGYIPEHIQSHFIAVRKDFFKTADFQDYWDNMPMIHDYREAVGFHEAIFTKKFADLGYKWDVYSELPDNFSHNAIICAPKELLEQTRCPIFKRRSFMQDYGNMVDETYGQPTMELYNYIRDYTDYNTDLIWDNILRLENLAVIKKNMQFNFILPTNQSEDVSSVLSKKKIALVMHIYYEDQAEICLKYAKSMPEETDVYITTDSKKKLEHIKNVFANLKCNKLEIRLRENKGRDLSTLIVAFRDEIKQYDYVCYAHDKKVKQIEPRTIGYGFAYKCFENILSTKDFVKNVLYTFETNPRLGMMTPPPPNHGEYYFIIGQEWGQNFENTKELAEKLKINVPISEKFEPISALGSMFWFRPKALRKILDVDWKYSDFPDEPVADDGTILHAIERLHGFAAQSEGYYSGYLLADKCAAIELTNLEYDIRTLNGTLFSHGCASGRIYGVNQNLFNMLEAYRHQADVLTEIGKRESKIHRRILAKLETLQQKLKKKIKGFVKK